MPKSRVCMLPIVSTHRSTEHRLEYVKKYATQEAIDQDAGDDDAGDDMSSVGSYDSGEEEGEAAGNMDDI